MGGAVPPIEGHGPLKGGAQWEVFESLGVCSKRGLWDPSLPGPVCLCLIHLFCHDVAPSVLSSEASRAPDPGLGTRTTEVCQVFTSQAAWVMKEVHCGRAELSAVSLVSAVPWKLLTSRDLILPSVHQSARPLTSGEW